MQQQSRTIIYSYVKQRARYIRQFCISPRAFGSLSPSSRWLCRKMISLADWKKVKTVAELGAGDGVLTHWLLTRLALGTQLDAYEIDEKLAKQLQMLSAQDNELNVFIQSAEVLNRNYDLIFSCLPLLSMPIAQRLRIVREVHMKLNPGGTFILYQYSVMSEKLLSRYFEWIRVFEFRNIPPAWIYICTPHK